MSKNCADEHVKLFTFKVNESDCELNEETVKILTSSGKHDHGSSKVKLKNIVDYKWELKHYTGHLITVHNDGNHIAYAINVNKKSSGMEGMIRVVNAQSGQRALIKGMAGEILDIQFAHIENQRILASIDVKTLYVHEINLANAVLACNLLIKIEHVLKDYTPKYDKICWCPYAEISSEEDDDESQLIVWTRDSLFQCFNINTIVRENEVDTIHPDNLTSGYVKMKDDSISITWVALSPDGSTLSVGSTDGVIKFYQVYMFEEELRCLHQWTPHNGKGISSFFFLDDLTKKVSDTYWKFAITGALNNTEVKLWDCSSWKCIQTIILSSCHLSKNVFRLLAEVDKTASYFILSSLENRTCYVIEIERYKYDTYSKMNSNDENSTQTSLKFKRISEFPLSSGILSFSIVGVTVKNFKSLNDEYMSEIDEYENESFTVDIRMFIVQCKSMQECHILFQPKVGKKNTNFNKEGVKPINFPLFENISDPIDSIKDTIFENSNSQVSASQETNEELKELMSLKPVPFPSKDQISHKNVNSDVLNTILMLANVASQNQSAEKSDEQQKIEKKHKNSDDVATNKSECVNETLMSGESSPSREVEEILSLRKEKKSSSDDDITLSCSQAAHEVFTSSMSNNLENITELLPAEPTTKWIKSIDTSVVLKSTSKSRIAKTLNQTLNLSSTKESSSHDLYKKCETNCVNANNIGQLTELVKLQTMKIDSLQKDLVEFQNSSKIFYTEVTELFLKLDMKVSNFELNLKRCENDHLTNFATFLSEQDKKRRSLCDQFVLLSNQCFHTQCSDLQSKVTADIQRTLTPIIIDKLNIMNQQIQTNLSQRMYSFTELLKTNLSKEIVDGLNNLILQNVQKSLQSAFIESMSTTLIPAYEKSSQNMFKQLHDAFSIGIKEFLDQFYAYVENFKPARESFEEATEEIGTLRLNLDNLLLKHRNTIKEIVTDTQTDIKNLEISLLQHIREAVCSELKKYMDSSPTTLSLTNIPSYDVKDSIKLLLQQGQINKAFHQALLVNDFKLVEFTLKLADHHAVFNPSCCLEQKVLLSLIQQISADMNNHNEIKQNYLAEALLAINPLDPVTREHAPKILQELFRNCQNFLKNYPKSLQCSNVRMLMKGVEAYKEHFQY